MDALIKDDIVTLTLKVEIPKHYYDFFEHLEETYGYDSNILEKMAADGIILDLNSIQESLLVAVETGEATIKPDLSIGTKCFKAQIGKKEDRQP